MPQSKRDARESEIFNLGLSAAKKVQDDAKRLGLGPTGKYPQGKLTDNDEGELGLGITHLNGKVVIEFGVPIVGLGMSPDDARDMAASLLRHAAQAESEAPIA